MKPAQSLLNTNVFEKVNVIERNGFIKIGNTLDTNVYLIEKGTVRIFVMDGDEERTIRFGYPGNIVVALDSFLTEKPSDYFIQAIKKTVIHVARKAEIKKFVESSEKNLTWWKAVLEDLIIQQMERERDLLTSSPAERYRRVLKRSPQLFQQIPKKHIANYLRMTPETLSRLKKS